MRLNIITLACLLTSMPVFAANVAYTSCVDVSMFNQLDESEKEAIEKSATPEQEKLRFYKLVHLAKYNSSVTTCQQADAAAQMAARASAASVASSRSGSSGAVSGGASAGALAGTAAAVQAGLQVADKIYKGRTPGKVAAGDQIPVASSEIPSGGGSHSELDKAATDAKNKNTDTTTSETNSVRNQVGAGDENANSEVAAKSEEQPKLTSNQLDASTERQALELAQDKSNAVKETFFKQEQADVKKLLGSKSDSSVGGVAEPSNAGSFLAPPTEITEAAKAKTESMQKQLSQAAQVGQYLTLLPQSAQAYNLLMQKLKNYMTTSKDSCVTTAERANLLCVESPGLKKVKNIMDIAGPVLAATSAASKSCSSLGKITSLASTGVAIARGVCVASKYMCDSSCTKSVSELADINKDLANLKVVMRAEATNNCNSNSNSNYCAKLEANFAAAQPGLASITPALTSEAALVAGTSVAMQAKCTGYGKEVIQMGISLAGLLKAKSGAQECEKALSTAAAGPAVTTQQYCEVPVNAVTDMCKCQKDSMAAGCPGSLVSGSKAENSINAGNNIRPTSGVSGFAGGGSASVTPNSNLPKSTSGLKDSVAAQNNLSGSGGFGADSGKSCGIGRRGCLGHGYNGSNGRGQVGR